MFFKMVGSSRAADPDSRQIEHKAAFERLPPLDRDGQAPPSCHSDSLPGLRSVMDGMESSGSDFSLFNETANAAAASTAATRPTVLARGKTGIAGLKRSAIVRKQIVQRCRAERNA